MIIPQDVINRLNTDFSVKVVSSPGLIADIQRRQHARTQQLVAKGLPGLPTKTAITPIAMFQPSKPAQVSPFALLHSIGRITTPQVPNLADLSSTWAIYRYIWAFDIHGNGSGLPLRLADAAREIDFHQKTLLSDEVGMGMANYIMTNYFRTTSAVDVSLALKTPSWHVIQQGSASPDYLFYDDPSKTTFVVECKGNQSSYPATIQQLQRGTEQVPSILFTDGRRSVSIVIGTCMLSQDTRVYVVDPESQVPDEYEDKDDYYGKSERIGPSQWRVTNDELFESDSRLFSRAKLLMYAGSELEALAQLSPDVRKYWEGHARKPSEITELETSQGVFEGVTDSFRTFDGHTISLYRGLLKELRNQFLVPLETPEQRQEYSKQHIAPPESYSSQFKEKGFLVSKTEKTTGYGIQSVCHDGSVMQLSIA